MTRGPTTPTSSRYRLLLKLASGGMGTVYLGQQMGAGGFHRLVAIKRAHSHLIDDAESVRMFLAEAALASVVRHPNVVGVIDVVDDAGELLLVLDYVEGGSLSQISLGSSKLPLAVAVRILLDAAEGLDAVHSARSDEGEPLGLVHRDVSPQNILVGVDGVARVADFGIAKATRSSHTQSGLVRGKPGYLAPEYVTGARPTAAMDVFSMGIVAWEMLTGRRLFKGANDAETLERVRTLTITPPSVYDESISPALDDVVLRALAREPAERFSSAADLVRALRLATRVSSPNMGESVDVVASHQEVGALVAELLGERLAARRDLLRRQSTPNAIPAPQKQNAFGEVTTRVEHLGLLPEGTHRSVEVPVTSGERGRLSMRTASLAAALLGLSVGATARAGLWLATNAAPQAVSASPAMQIATAHIEPPAPVAVTPRPPPTFTHESDAPPPLHSSSHPTAFRRGTPVAAATPSDPVKAPASAATVPSAPAAPEPSAHRSREPAPTLIAQPPDVAPSNPYGSSP